MFQQCGVGKFLLGVDQEVVVRGVFLLGTHDEVCSGNAHYQTDSIKRFMRKINQDVEIPFGELFGQRLFEAAVPIHVFVAEEIGGELGEAVERDLLVVDVAHQPHLAVCILKMGKNGINFLIRVLCGNITDQTHRFSFLQRDHIYISNLLVISNVPVYKMSLYKIHHSKMRETKLKAQK